MKDRGTNYDELAKACFDNAKDLFDDAKLLFDYSRFPRSYALCVLSIEELAKSMVWKNRSLGFTIAEDELILTKGKKPRNVITDHKGKQALAISPFLLVQMLLEKPQGKLLPEQREKSETYSNKELLVKRITEMDSKKQASIYVDKLGYGMIRIPREQTSKKNCEEIISIVSHLLIFYGAIRNMKISDFSTKDRESLKQAIAKGREARKNRYLRD